MNFLKTIMNFQKKHLKKKLISKEILEKEGGFYFFYFFLFVENTLLNLFF